jgi:hypothetical protein
MTNDEGKSGFFSGIGLRELLLLGTVIGIVGIISAFAVLSARSRARDVTRLAHVRELQLGLELYFNTNGAYPAAEGVLALGQATTACLSEDGFGGPCSTAQTRAPYVEFVPAPPESGLRGKSSCDGVGNAYCYQTDASTFRIQFELEKANTILGLVKGANCATEQGFAAGACTPYQAAQ